MEHAAAGAHLQNLSALVECVLGTGNRFELCIISNGTLGARYPLGRTWVDGF